MAETGYAGEVAINNKNHKNNPHGTEIPEGYSPATEAEAILEQAALSRQESAAGEAIQVVTVDQSKAVEEISEIKTELDTLHGKKDPLTAQEAGTVAHLEKQLADKKYAMEVGQSDAHKAQVDQEVAGYIRTIDKVHGFAKRAIIDNYYALKNVATDLKKAYRQTRAAKQNAVPGEKPKGLLATFNEIHGLRLYNHWENGKERAVPLTETKMPPRTEKPSRRFFAKK